MKYNTELQPWNKIDGQTEMVIIEPSWEVWDKQYC